MTLCIGLTALPGIAEHSWTQQVQGYEITPVADGLYSAASRSPRSISHRTVFLVTDEGIVLADPISTAFSTWLKSEFDERFGVPVRYVLYSHHHWDHASGGAVFADTATYIAHEGMAAALAAPLPSNAVSRDANGLTLQQAQRSVQLSEYSDWLHFDGRRENVIASAYAILTHLH